MASTPERHEVVAHDGDEVSVSCHEFAPTRGGGSRVVLSERSGQMPLGVRVGFWLQDYLADHLTDEIDRAEGRAARANRDQKHAQLVVDIANRFFPRGDAERAS